MQMMEDSKLIYDYFQKELGVNPQKIIIFGRSIGTGPATYLASERKDNKLLILLSPFTTINNILKDKFYSRFITLNKHDDEFKNNVFIKNVNYPIFIVHGKKDGVIKYKHSEELIKLCNNKNNSELNLVDNMYHNGFSHFDVLLNPVNQFLRRLKISDDNTTFNTKEYYEKLDQKKYLTVQHLTTNNKNLKQQPSQNFTEQNNGNMPRNPNMNNDSDPDSMTEPRNKTIGNKFEGQNTDGIRNQDHYGIHDGIKIVCENNDELKDSLTYSSKKKEY
jgi:hypothetical protein